MKVMKPESRANVVTTNFGELKFEIEQSDGMKAEISWDRPKDILSVWKTVTVSCVDALVRRVTGR